jgi:quinoprotein glucose dehydrogenase
MKVHIVSAVIIPLATVAVLKAAAVRAQEPAQETTKSVWDGVYTEEQANRGRQGYSDHCASCHGPELTGGEMAPALAGGDFLAGWDGLTMGDLFERIRISMPQDSPGSLSGQQNADILAFMLASNKFPAGQTELARDAMILKTIKFEARKSGR